MSDHLDTRAGSAHDSLELPPLASVDDGVDSLALALGERRLRAKLLGEPLEPLRVGRFELEHQLGAGGMGTVWRAHDHELGRPVALKFLHARHASEAGQRRFEREARALARISHPNVVPVFEVGRHEGQTWIAMEFVPGSTLREWSERERPDSGRSLAAWLAAGRGLAAVHDAGLVHRDIKPDNIMIGDDGRVRLVDFGLVCRPQPERELGRTELDGEESGPEDSGPSGSQTVATRAGGFAGTPAYAAPEQLDGRPVDARSDQYAFCVSLWEALSGARPKRDLAPGAASRSEAQAVPLRLRKALLRGLDPDPEARFADMDALLRALAPPRRRWLAPSLAGVLAGGVGLGLAAVAEPEAPAADPCALAGEPITAVWNEDRRAQLDARLGPALASASAELIEAWTEAWRASAGRSCEAHAVEGIETRERYARRQACLADASAQLERLLDGVGAGELACAEVIAAWLSELPDPARCETDALTELDPAAPPAALREQVEAIAEGLLRIRHDLDDQSSLARLDAVAAELERATQLGWTPLVREAAVLGGELALLAGDEVRARASLGLALDLGLDHGDRDLVREVHGALARVELLLALDPEAGAWHLAREVALVDEDEPRPAAAAVLAEDQGLLALLRGDLDEAERAYARAAAQWQRAGPRHGWRRAGSLRRQANVVDARGRSEAAAKLYAAARALEQLGLPSPAPDARAYDEGVAAYDRGELDVAEPLLREALAGGRELGPNSVFVAQTHVALSGLYDARGDIDAALDHALAAEAILVETVGPAHPARTTSLTALGVAHYRARRLAAAVEAFERALIIAERSGAPPRGTSDYAVFELNLGDALYELGGQDRRARALLEQALAVLEVELGPEHPALAVALKALGGLALRRRQPDAAVRALERARSLDGVGANNPVEQAEIGWLLAQALVDAGEGARGRAEARAAREAFAALGPTWAPRADEIRTWLEAEAAESSSNPNN